MAKLSNKIRLLYRTALNDLEQSEVKFIENKNYFIANLTVIKFALLISTIPSIMLTILIILSTIFMKSLKYNSFIAALNTKYFLYSLFVLVTTFIPFFILFCVPKFIINNKYPYIKCLVKINKVLNFSKSAGMKRWSFLINFIKCVVISAICIIVIMFPVYFFLTSFSISVDTGKLYNTILVFMIATLLFLSIYLLPEEENNQKYLKNHSKFFLWLTALGLNIYSVYYKFKVDVSSLELLFNGIALVITFERLYKTYLELEGVYDVMNSKEISKQIIENKQGETKPIKQKSLVNNRN